MTPPGGGTHPKVPEPRCLGRFDLLAELGKGGLTTTYLARSVAQGGFQRLVALKVVHPELVGSEGFLDGFFDEVHLAAEVRHANVCTVIDAALEGGAAYVVAEYIEGDTLAALVRACAREGVRLSYGIVLRVALDALAGLHAAHERVDTDGSPAPLVHRDVSPWNVMVGVDGVARVTDFGFARAAGKVSVTKVKNLQRRLGYVAPEQLSGRPVDRRGDLFCLAAALWETLTLRPLYAGSPDDSRSRWVARGAYLSLRTVDPSLPVVLDRILERALMLDPAQRYVSAAAMTDDLEAQLGSEVASAREVARAVLALCAARLEVERGIVRAAQTGAPGSVHSRPTPASGARAVPRVTDSGLSIFRADTQAGLRGSVSKGTLNAAGHVPPGRGTPARSTLRGQTPAGGWGLRPGTPARGVAPAPKPVSEVDAGASWDSAPPPAPGSNAPPSLGTPGSVHRPATKTKTTLMFGGPTAENVRAVARAEGVDAPAPPEAPSEPAPQTTESRSPSPFRIGPPLAPSEFPPAPLAGSGSAPPFEARERVAEARERVAEARERGVAYQDSFLPTISEPPSAVLSSERPLLPEEPELEFALPTASETVGAAVARVAAASADLGGRHEVSEALVEGAADYDPRAGAPRVGASPRTPGPAVPASLLRETLDAPAQPIEANLPFHGLGSVVSSRPSGPGASPPRTTPQRPNEAVRPSREPGLPPEAPGSALHPRFVQPRNFSPPPTSAAKALALRIGVGILVGLAVGLPLLWALSRK